MTDFIRKNLILLDATFTPVQGVVGAPSSAQIVLVYKNTSGAMVRDILPMTLQNDGVTWRAVWDSSQTIGGVVQWMTYCSGGLVGSDEGSFTINANGANVI